MPSGRARRRALALIALALIGAPRLARPRSARLPRIGYLLLSPVTEPPSAERRAFLEGLRALGYVPGRTIEIVYRSAEGAADFMDALARDLVAEGPDVIVTSGAAATLAAKQATQSIPVVFLALGDPVGVGAIRSLAQPGGNVTGVSFISSDLAPKRVQFVRDLLPRARHMTILWNSDNENAHREAEAVRTAARKLGFTVEWLGLATSAELVRAYGDLEKRRPEVLYAAFEGGLVAFNRTAIAEFGLRHRIGVVSGWTSMAEAGGLMSYAPDIPAMFHRGAYYVHRVLQGEKPANLPVELPTRIEMVVNLRTAKALGIEVPQSILLRADRVIE